MADPYSAASVAKQLKYCTYCPKMCRHACPVSNASGKETHTPNAKMERLHHLEAGTVPWTSDTTKALWACTGCRQCTGFCDHDNEPGLVLLAGRASANARGVTHPNLVDYPTRFRNRERRLGTVLREAVPRSRLSDDAVVGYWPGCDAVDKSLDDILAALELFDTIGADHVRLVDAEPVCAGYPLLAAGYPDMFRWHAGRVAAAVKNFRTIVVNCSACLYSLRVQYPAEGVHPGPEILSLAEFLGRAINDIPEPAERRRVYYHDPCHLARYSSIIEAPRRVLSRVAEVRDFEWSHGLTECCGGAGLLPKTMPDTADAMARRRLREIAQRGGGHVVTSCATCTFMLKRNAPAGVEVDDLPGFLAKVAQS